MSVQLQVDVSTSEISNGLISDPEQLAQVLTECSDQNGLIDDIVDTEAYNAQVINWLRDLATLMEDRIG